MLRRFAAGSVVACIATAIASVVVLMISGLAPQRLALILAFWCMVPCVWGLWAMLAPSTWVPQRLPIWGMLLGIFGGLMAVFVVNIPYRILGVALSTTTGVFGVVVAAVFYYLLWTVVRIVYAGLPGSSSVPSGR